MDAADDSLTQGYNTAKRAFLPLLQMMPTLRWDAPGG